MRSNVIYNIVPAMFIVQVLLPDGALNPNWLLGGITIGFFTLVGFFANEAWRTIKGHGKLHSTQAVFNNETAHILKNLTERIEILESKKTNHRNHNH